jgi:hypothetical protein
MNQRYTVSSMYHAFLHGQCGIPGAKELTKVRAPPSYKFFVWLALLGGVGLLITSNATVYRIIGLVPYVRKPARQFSTCSSAALVVAKCGSICCNL